MTTYDDWLTSGPPELCDWCEEQEAESSGLCAECWDERERLKAEGEEPSDPDERARWVA